MHPRSGRGFAGLSADWPAQGRGSRVGEDVVHGAALARLGLASGTPHRRSVEARCAGRARRHRGHRVRCASARPRSRARDMCATPTALRRLPHGRRRLLARDYALTMLLGGSGPSMSVGGVPTRLVGRWGSRCWIWTALPQLPVQSVPMSGRLFASVAAYLDTQRPADADRPGGRRVEGPNLGRSLTATGLEEILDGIRVAVFWRKVNDRVLRPLLAAPDPPPVPIALRRARVTIDRVSDDYAKDSRLSAATCNLSQHLTVAHKAELADGTPALTSEAHGCDPGKQEKRGGDDHRTGIRSGVRERGDFHVDDQPIWIREREDPKAGPRSQSEAERDDAFEVASARKLSKLGEARRLAVLGCGRCADLAAGNRVHCHDDERVSFELNGLIGWIGRHFRDVVNVVTGNVRREAKHDAIKCVVVADIDGLEFRQPFRGDVGVWHRYRLGRESVIGNDP